MKYLKHIISNQSILSTNLSQMEYEQTSVDMTYHHIRLLCQILKIFPTAYGQLHCASHLHDGDSLVAAIFAVETLYAVVYIFIVFNFAFDGNMQLRGGRFEGGIEAFPQQL